MAHANHARNVLIAITMALPMLGAVVWARASADTGWIPTETYHQSVTEAVSRIPKKIDDMEASKAELPPAGAEILKPNALDARLFLNLQTSQAAIVDFVQSKNARDLVGHYPPICYVANGWQAIGTRPVDLDLNGKKYHLVEYAFTRYVDATGMQTLYALDIMIIPGTGVTTDMNLVSRRGSDYRRKEYGAAQIQIVFNYDKGAESRDIIARKLLIGYLPLIHTVIDGVKP